MNYMKKTTVSHTSENGICEIRTEGELSPELIHDCFQASIQERGLPSGILLDVRRSAPLSMVRVSTVLDMLTRFSIPVAVVFLWPQQLELASLLHHTLPHHELVAYFIEITDAKAFLASRTP